MTPSEPSAVRALLHDGITPLARPVRVLVSGDRLHVLAGAFATEYRLDQVTVSPKNGSGQRFIDLPDGSELQCSDARLSVELSAITERSGTNSVVAWFDDRWWAALGSAILTCAVLAFFYSIGSPYLASYVSSRVDLSYERALGEHTLKTLDRLQLAPSELSVAKRAEITHAFHGLAAGLPRAESYRLEFRKGHGGVASANAFALPGGLVVVTDAMFEACSHDGVIAVLAHELGHVERRHAVRQVLQDSSVSLVLSVITADLASVATSISGLPEGLATKHYSREMEREADAFAFTLLARHGFSPEAFAVCMDRLSASYEETPALSFLSTHPVSAERSALARARAGELEKATPAKRPD